MFRKFASTPPSHCFAAAPVAEWKKIKKLPGKRPKHPVRVEIRTSPNMHLFRPSARITGIRCSLYLTRRFQRIGIPEHRCASVIAFHKYDNILPAEAVWVDDRPPRGRIGIAIGHRSPIHLRPDSDPGPKMIYCDTLNKCTECSGAPKPTAALEFSDIRIPF